ncbi:MAG: preprotein translocase subunit SecE [Gammaproteobacteria bacterium]|nr:preprotein translocase subunit SecE [Gammaproteobacteria bacterium]
MSEQEASNNPALDIVKLMLALIIIIASLVVYYHFDQESQLYRVLGVVGATIIALALTATTQRGKVLLGFFKEVRTELKKVVWPTRPETTQTTLIVIVMVFVVGIILWLFDMFFFWGIQTLTGQVG